MIIKIAMTLLTVALAASAGAQQTQTITRAGTVASAIGPAEYFTGRVQVDMLTPATADINAATAYVTFAPGARSAWHTHPKGQYLIVTAGAGLTQQWGQPVQQLRPGDVVWCPPGVKHWHGAAPTTALTHIALTGTLDGKSVQWLEQVGEPAAAASLQEKQTMQAEQLLSPSRQAIGPVAALTATGDIPRLKAALHQGLDAGLTISESREVLVQMYAYTGFPRSLNALTALMQVLDERRARGINDAAGEEAAPALTGEALLASGTANQTRLAGAPVRGPVFDFAPAIDQYLKTHLFGDIFNRANLDWQSRELATVAALAALSGVEPQLQSHLRVSMNVGLSEQQLRQFIQVLATRVDAATAQRAQVALDQLSN